MSEDTPHRRALLIRLAAEGIIPVLGGCCGALACGPEAGAVGGMAGVAVGQVVEKAINFFGARIVERWYAWFRDQPAESRLAAIADLAALTPDEARHEAGERIRELAPDAEPADISLALDYLSAIPFTIDRALIVEPGTGRKSVPATISLDEPQALLQLLPADVPPYRVPGPLPGTPYHLEKLLGSGGFGAVYKAASATLQHLPLAIKFCLDRSLIAALQRERSNLEQLMKAGGEGWSRRIVRLYGYDLDHRTPYLVYEYIPGGDLLHHVGQERVRLGRNLNPAEVFALMVQVTESLSYAHKHGLVHRDLKPANILVEDGMLKLADFGLGGVMAARASVSKIGSTTLSLLTAADRVSLFRGAGTPLYMSPEQRRGANPDARHDLYSLGVMWYQLLVGDTTRELHAGWAKELVVRHQVPKEHIDLIERCVGWFDERPKDASELLALLRASAEAKPAGAASPAAISAAPVHATSLTVNSLRQQRLRSLLTQLRQGHLDLAQAQRRKTHAMSAGLIVGIYVLVFLLLIVGIGFLFPILQRVL